MVLNLDRIDILRYKQKNRTSDYDTIFYYEYNKSIYNIKLNNMDEKIHVIKLSFLH